MLGVKNPIYIENYGYTFNNPYDFGYLASINYLLYLFNK